jgi:hypothetical protein
MLRGRVNSLQANFLPRQDGMVKKAKTYRFQGGSLQFTTCEKCYMKLGGSFKAGLYNFRPLRGHITP